MLASRNVNQKNSSNVSFRLQLVRLEPELRHFARRLAKNDEVARDLVQDAIERALKFEAYYTPETNMRAWVRQILFSVFITLCRRQKRERLAFRRYGDQIETMCNGHERIALTRRTQEAIHQLPDVYREAIQLIDLQDCSYKEAADIVSVPAGTMMSRLHRGRKMLAEELSFTEQRMAA